MATEKELIDRKLDIYDNADAELLESLKDVEKFVYERVAKLLEKLSKNGKLSYDNLTTAEINKLNKDILEAIESSKYSDRVSEYLRNFDTLDELNKDLIFEVNGIEIENNLEPLKKDAINNVVNQLTAPQSIGAQMATPIKEIVLRSVVAGMEIDQAKKLLKQFIQGDPQRLGHLSRYVGQISRDALSQYDGIVNDAIRHEYGLNAYRYVGSLVEDSRPQCVRWVKEKKGVLLFSELEKEISWAFNNGKGMNPFTTPDNFAAFRGGYNCRHAAIPFRADVEEEQPKEAKKPNPKEPETFQYKESKTKAEAKQFIKDMFKELRAIDIDEVSFDASLSIDDVNLKNKDLFNLLSDYYSGAVINRQHKTTKVQYKSKKTTNGIKMGVISFKNSQKVEYIELNFGSATKDTKLPSGKTIEEFNSVNGGIFGTSYESNHRILKYDNATLFHEFAHFTVSERMGANILDKDFFVKLRAIKKDYMVNLVDLAKLADKSKVQEIYMGEYANTNLDEFLAESFAEYKLAEKPSKYAKLVGELFDEYYKINQ